MNCNKLTFGLFMYKGWYFYKNIRDIPILIKRVFFTLRHGYAPQAHWETYYWFMSCMKEILLWYRENRAGTPFIVDDYDENIDCYNKILDRMVELLDLMEEDNILYEELNYEEVDAARDNAKNEFFELFSKYFYTFWD